MYILHVLPCLFYHVLECRTTFLYVQTQLVVEPAFLLCFMDVVVRVKVSDQKWGFWIMHFHIVFHKIGIRISIAVPAQMSACIISSDISAEQAGA